MNFFNSVLLTFVLILPTADGCYQRDLHHELPCAIVIDQSPSRPQNAVPPTIPPSIQGAAHTDLPTVIITIVSSPAPVAPPSTSPTSPLTATPVAPPTFTPVTPPSTSPTSAPSTQTTVAPVTASPTVSPTSTPTNSPSSKPSSVPTSKPTKLDCKANTNGFFGGMSGSPMLISYGYELETTPISQNTLQNEVLPSLKNNFVNSLLPNLFGNQCAGGRRMQSVRRQLQIVGISARPDDVPLSNVACKTTLANSANNCSVVSGELTLFTNGNGTDEVGVIQNVLQAGMASGKYVKADSHIVRVTYVNLGSYSSLSNGNTGNPKGTSATSSSNRYLLAIVPAVAAAILVVAAIFWRRRRHMAGDSDDSTNPTASRDPRGSANAAVQEEELPPGLPAPMSLEEGTVYTSESNL